MATQMELARAGRITAAMERVAEAERLSPETIREGVARGRVVVCANPAHTGLTPCGVGEGLRVKVNANIGTSTAFPDLAPELEKLDAAVRYGADAVMDLSTGGDTTAARRDIISRSPVMVGTVPIYEAAVRAARERGAAVDMTAEDILETIEQQAKDGADFMTIHCGLVREAVNRLRREGREMDVVSRGGAFLTGWMLHNEKENPVYERFDDILDICVKYDVTVSLGDGLRPGCLADATDRAQLTELIVLGELVDRAWARGVQVMVEGPGHMPFDQIAANMKLEKELCHGAPFYVLGPLVTDIAPGYDHITAAIGGTMAAVSGADFLCYVTPAEHLGLPTVADVRDGVIAARIAAHAADVVKGVPGAREWDDHMARARKRLDWNEQFALAVDPDRAKERRAARNTADEDACSMCGDFCAMEIAKRYMEEKPEKEAVLAAAVLAAEDAAQSPQPEPMTPDSTPAAEARESDAPIGGAATEEPAAPEKAVADDMAAAPTPPIPAAAPESDRPETVPSGENAPAPSESGQPTENVPSGENIPAPAESRQPETVPSGEHTPAPAENGQLTETVPSGENTPAPAESTTAPEAPKPPIPDAASFNNLQGPDRPAIDPTQPPLGAPAPTPSPQESVLGTRRPSFCVNCGAKLIDPSMKFCTECGHPIKLY